MADENEKATLDPQPRRRVPPPTIDLEAADVSPTDSTAGSAAASSSAAAPDAGSRPPESRATDDTAESAEPSGGTRTGPGWRSAGVAGLVGAMVALAAAGGAWVLLDGGPDGVAEMNTRLARAEAQLAALPQQPDASPAATDPKPVDDLARRVDALETARASTHAPAADDAALADLNRRIDAVAVSARAAQQRADAAAKTASDAASKAADAARPAPPSNAPPAAERRDLDALAARVARLESADNALTDRLAKAQSNLETKIASESASVNAVASAAAAAPAVAREAVAALALELAVERGAPYAHALAAIDPARANKAALDALSPLAETGVPSASALARELAGLIPAARAAAAEPVQQGDLLERLQAHAERLVRVRPIGEPKGDDPTAVLARLEIVATHADLAAARADVAKLPSAARAVLDPWSKRAAARAAALDAAATLVAGALDALHEPKGAPTR